MSRVNIVVSYKIYSLTDTYYAVGSSETGSFGPFKLGKGRDLYEKSNAASLSDLDLDSAKLEAFENPDTGGQLVSGVIPLGEKYGDFKIRLYAENELGIRSPYVEADKLIIAPDISGTFKFIDATVRNLKHLKPSASHVITKAPTKTSNELRVYSEFIGRELFLQWSLRAPYGISGNARGVVDENIDFLDHFEIEFYKPNVASPGGFGVTTGNWDKVDVPSSFNTPISAADMSAYYNFNLSLTKDQITELYGEESRNVYIKIVGKDVYWSSASVQSDHEFSAFVHLENKKTSIKTCTAELYGKNLEIAYTNPDPDFTNENLKIGQWVLEEGEDYTDSTYYKPIGEKSFLGNYLTYEQDWSSTKFYRYVVTLSDAYGLCGYMGVKVPGGLGQLRGPDELGLALGDATPLQSKLEIGEVNITEVRDLFQLSWTVKDSRGHLVDIKDGKFSLLSPLSSNTGTEIKDIKGFTCSFECPSDYYSGSAPPPRDMLALDLVSGGSPTATSDERPIATITDETPLGIVHDQSFILTKEANANLYRSWFNEHNLSSQASNDETFRALYKQLSGDDVRDYGENGDFYAADAQRKVRLAVQLIDSTGLVIDEKSAVGYNPPPRIVADKIDRQSAGKVIFEAPYSEKVSTVRIYRRPYEKYHPTALFAPTLGGPTIDLDDWKELDSGQRATYAIEASTELQYMPRIHNVDKGTNPSNLDISLYNDKSDKYFVNGQVGDQGTGTALASTLSLMLYNAGINVDTPGEALLYDPESKDVDEWGHEYGFHVATSPGGGNFVNSPTHGLEINKGDSVSYIDEPPVLRLDGIAQTASYDYVIIPYDDFGSGIAFENRVNIAPPDIYSSDEDGAIGILDFDPPEAPSNLTIDGANKTFFMEWEASQSHDLESYNLMYIRDTRSETDRLSLGTKITASSDRYSYLNFANPAGVYNHPSSEFHAKDLKFSTGENATAVPDWPTGSPYAKDLYVGHSRDLNEVGGQKTVKRLYKSKENTNTDEPTKSSKWQLQSNAQVFDNGEIVYTDDVETFTRDDASPTWKLIFWQKDKAYAAGEIAFSDSKCYRAEVDINAPADNDLGLTNKWEEVVGVSIQEIRIPRQETSLTVVARTGDRGYFFLESVDRTNNRSRLHFNPLEDQGSGSGNEFVHTLGQSDLLDIKDFEKNLSSEFPNSILLRPNEPFEILNPTTPATAKLKWKSHYIYNDGKAHFVKGGEISLLDPRFTAIPIDQNTGGQYIQYVYWDRNYGYDIDSVNGNTFKIAESVTVDGVAGEKAIRDNADDVDSGIEGKEADETYDHIARYSFCTGNPTSNAYNLRVKTAVVDEYDAWDRLSDIKVTSTGFGYDDLVDLLNGTDTTEPIHNDATKFGAYGIHIPKSDKLTTDETKSLQKDGNLQIARIDFIGEEFSVTQNFVAFNNATIGQAWISDATITNAQITDLKADKITTGVIGSHKIEIGNGLIPNSQDGELVDGQDDNEPGSPNVDSTYRYGAITSKDFGHKTQGKAGFFISGDGQFGFQTETGGLYLRTKENSSAPTELFFRGIWHQEEGVPALFMGMTSHVQSITFDEHAQNHFYYEDAGWKVYGTEASVVYPSDGRAVVDFTIDNAYHNDGSPYTNDQLKFRIFADGDVAGSKVGTNELSNILVAHEVYLLDEAADVPEGTPEWIDHVVWSDPDALGALGVEQADYIKQANMGIGLTDPDDINQGGSFTLDFIQDTDSTIPAINFTGAPITNTVGNEAEEIDIIRDRLEEEDLIDQAENLELEAADAKIHPIADSYTVELIIKAKTDAFDSAASMYYKGDLVHKGADIYRAKQVMHSPVHEPDVTAGWEDYWNYVTDTATGVEQKRQAIHIYRKDQPANLVSFALVPQGGTLLENGNIDSTLTVDAQLTYGSEVYTLKNTGSCSISGHDTKAACEDAAVGGTWNDNNWPDWIKTSRSQLAIYQGFPNASSNTKFLHVVSADSGALQINATAADIIDGKATYYLVDRGTTAFATGTPSLTNLGSYNILDTIALADVEDGAVAVFDIDADNQFITREVGEKAQSYSSSELFTVKKVKAKFSLPVGAGASSTVHEEEFQVDVRADVGNYILDSGIGIYKGNAKLYLTQANADNDVSGKTLAQWLALPTTGPNNDDSQDDYRFRQASNRLYSSTAGAVGIFSLGAVTYPDLSTGFHAKGRISFTVDNAAHVSEINLLVEAVVHEHKSFTITEASDITGKKIISAEETIYVNTVVPSDPALRLTLLRPFISYAENPTKPIKGRLDRAENIVPLQLLMGKDNVTDESSGVATVGIEMVPSYGFIVDSSFLNGTNTGKHWPKDSSGTTLRDKARGLINGMKNNSQGESNGADNVFYYDGTNWHFTDPASTNPVAKIDTSTTADYLYYIPDNQKYINLTSHGDSKIQIKASYTRTVPYQRLSSGTGTNPKTFTDIETLKIVKLIDGTDSAFVTLDNSNVEIPLTYDAALEKNFNFETASSNVKGFLGEIRIGVVPDKIKIGSSVFTLSETVDSALTWTGSITSSDIAAEPVKSVFTNTYLPSGDTSITDSELAWKDASDVAVVFEEVANGIITKIKIPLSTEDVPQPGENYSLCAYSTGDDLLAYSKMPAGYEDGMFRISNDPASHIGEAVKFASTLTSKHTVVTHEGTVPVVPYYKHYLDTGGDPNTLNAGSILTNVSGGKPYFEVGTATGHEAISIDLDFKFYKHNNSFKVPSASQTATRRFLARRTGHHGSTPTYRGVWTAGNVYFGNKDRRDLVFKGDGVYIAREGADEAAGTGTAGFTAVAENDTDPKYTSLDLQTNYWSEFGANFQSVATNLLLAEDVFVKRGIVAGVDNSHDAFFASQIDNKYFAAGLGGYKVPTTGIEFGSGVTPAEISAENSVASYTITEKAANEIPEGSLGASTTSVSHYSNVDGHPVVTTHKLPMTPVPGFFLGYYDTARANIPSSNFPVAGQVAQNLPTLFPRLPMLELQSPFGNFFRWNGLSLEMFGAVINGSISDEAVDVRIGSSGAASVKFNVPIYGGQIFCGGGFANYIPNDHDHIGSAIVGGGHNKIKSNADYGGKFSFIGGGYGNLVQNEFSFIGSGYRNVIGHKSDVSADKIGNSFNAIVTGRANRIFKSKYSLIGSGFGNSIDSSIYSSILNGQNNTIVGIDGKDYGTGLLDTGLSSLVPPSLDDVEKIYGSAATYLEGHNIFRDLTKLSNKIDDKDVYYIDNATIESVPAGALYYSAAVMIDYGSGWWFLTSEDQLFDKDFSVPVAGFVPETFKSLASIEGKWINRQTNASPFVYSTDGKFYLLRAGVGSRIEMVSDADINLASDDRAGISELTFTAMTATSASFAAPGAAPDALTSGALSDIPSLKRKIEYLVHGAIIDPTDPNDFSYNTIIGGSGNYINKSRNSVIMGSSGTSVHNLNSGVVGGLNNLVVGLVGGEKNSELAIFGSGNVFNYNTYDPTTTGMAITEPVIRSSVIGSHNTIFGCRRTVILGGGNHIKGADYSHDSDFSKIKGQEINILGTDNEVVVPGGYANNLSIFGSNFKLKNQEQITNAYYFGNPSSEGQVLARLFFAADGGAYFTGDVITFALSDKKHKTNVSTIESPVEKIMSLRGVFFDWKDTQNLYSGKDIGVIAQEVEKILPEVVQDRKSGMGVKYEKLTPLLIEGIKAQQATINELLARVEGLESRIDELK